MKKVFVAVLLVVMMAFPSSVFAVQEKIVVELDGEVLSVSPAPITENGRTLAPFRSIFEALGCTVEWDENTETVTGTKEGTTISFVIGSNKALVNGETKTLQAPAKTVNGRTMVPVRFIAEALNCSVEWDAANQKVSIDTQKPAQAGDAESSIYAIPGSGDYSGYRQLKGYPEEDRFFIYFEGVYNSHHIVTGEANFNPNEIIVWSENGKTYKSTKAQVYQFFSDMSSLQSLTKNYSGKYDSAWMKEKFGTTYTTWISLGAFQYDAERLVNEFLEDEAGYEPVNRYSM